MPENFQVLAALNEVYGFSFNNSVCRHKDFITEPSQLRHMTNFLSLWWNAFFHATNNNFKPEIVSYPNMKNASQYEPINTQMSQKSRDSSRHFLRLLVKRCTLLTSSSTKPRGVSPLWFYHKLRFIYSMNKLPRSWLLLLQQLNIKLMSVVKCRPLRNHPSLGWYTHDCLVTQNYHEKKKPRIFKKRTPSGSFFFKRPTCSSRDMRNCTYIVGA